MRNSEIAAKAAQYMSEHGHCRYMLADERGRVCFNGALMAAQGWTTGKWADITDSMHERVTAIGQAATAILARNGVTYDRSWPNAGAPYGAVGYNNAAQTTAEDVILLLKETAAELAACEERMNGNG